MGNPATGLEPLPLLEVDFSGLPENLPRILGYESTWEPDSPYWTQIRYRQATLPESEQRRLIDHSSRMFERLGCRDYARRSEGRRVGKEGGSTGRTRGAT